MKTRSKLCLLALIVGVLGVITLKFGSAKLPLGRSSGLNDLQKIGVTHQLEQEGRALVKEERYQEAEQKFIAADDSRYWLYQGRPNGMARGWLRDLYKYEGRFEEALDNLNYELKLSPTNQSSLDEKALHETLIKYRDQGDEKVIYGLVDIIKTQYVQRIPPGGYDPIASLRPLSNILRLYNTIGDHDAGIKMLDECLEYFKRQDIEKYGAYKPGHVDEAYMKVRAGFEQDKAEGFKGCAGQKPGEVCMGHATKALIDSDYFPW